MHTLKKIYCRTFQAGFRLAMPFMPYREPEILDSVTEIAPVLQKLGINSVLLIAGKTIRKSGTTAKLEQHLTAANIKYTIYDGTHPNPTVNNVEEALALYLKEEC